MHCNEIRKQLLAYVQGELTSNRRTMLRHHLQQCMGCRALLAELDPIAAAVLKSIETPRVPESLKRSVMLQARMKQWDSAEVIWHPILWWQMATVTMRSTAVLMMMMVLGLGTFMGMSTATHDLSDTMNSSPSINNLYAFSVLGDIPDASLASSYLNLVTPQVQRNQR